MAVMRHCRQWAKPVNVELVQSPGEWNALRDQWDSLLAASVFPSIFLSFDYLVRAYAVFHAEGSEPYILTLKNAEGMLLGIAPFRRSVRRHWGISQAVLEYLVTWEIDKPYVIARNGHENAVWGAIFSFLDANPAEWDLLELIEMPDFLRGATAVEQLFQVPGYRCQTSTGPDGPCIDLTQTWAQFLGAHKKYRMALNRLNRLCPAFEVVTYDNPSTIGEGLEHYIALERLSWKHGKVGLERNPLHIDFYHKLIPALAAKERGSIHILVNGEGRPMAGIICCSFEQTLYAFHTAYDPCFSQYSPGKLLMGLVLKEYMGHKTLKSVDLLCGFADYYKPWAARIIATTNLQVVRMSPGMRMVLAVQWLKGLF
jgi:CelD/BcsL family acetyltransferase involved in cellulose biosynthesis